MVRKKSNKIPKIRGTAKSSKVIIANQKQFDEKCDYSIEYKKGTAWEVLQVFKETGKVDKTEH